MVAGPAVTQVGTSTETIHDTVVSTIVQPATTFVTTLSGPVVTSLSTIFANGVTTVVTGIVSTMTWTEVSTVTMPAATGTSLSCYLPETDLTMDDLRSHDTVRAHPKYCAPDHHRTRSNRDLVDGESLLSSVSSSYSHPPVGDDDGRQGDSDTDRRSWSRQHRLSTHDAHLRRLDPSTRRDFHRHFPLDWTRSSAYTYDSSRWNCCQRTRFYTDRDECGREYRWSHPPDPIANCRRWWRNSRDHSVSYAALIHYHGCLQRLAPRSNGQVTAVDTPVASAPASASPSVGGGGTGTGTDTGGGNNGNGGGNNDNNNNQNGNM